CPGPGRRGGRPTPASAPGPGGPPSTGAARCTAGPSVRSRRTGRPPGRAAGRRPATGPGLPPAATGRTVAPGVASQWPSQCRGRAVFHVSRGRTSRVIVRGFFPSGPSRRLAGEPVAVVGAEAEHLGPLPVRRVREDDPLAAEQVLAPVHRERPLLYSRLQLHRVRGAPVGPRVVHVRPEVAVVEVAQIVTEIEEHRVSPFDRRSPSRLVA